MVCRDDILFLFYNKAIHRLLSCFSKPWVIHRGKTISGYERTYIVPDNEPGCTVFVVSVKESSRILNQKMADYILWNDKVIEADDENELFIDKWYDEIIIKR